MAVAALAMRAAGHLLDGYSLEISARDAERLDALRPLLPAGTPVSITYLPGETDAARVAAARAVRACGWVPVPHVAARRVASFAAFHEFLARLSDEAAVDRLFVIAGDVAAPLGSFADALALIEALPQVPHALRTVGISGYPDGHPLVTADALEQAMRAKLAALAAQGIEAEIMTQFTFDAAPVLLWLERLRAAGIGAPVRVGLPGPASVGTLLRFAARCGVGTSTKVMARYGASLTRLLATAGPDRMLDDLAAGLQPARHGPVAIHLYPFGGLRAAAAWAQEQRA